MTMTKKSHCYCHSDQQQLSSSSPQNQGMGHRRCISCGQRIRRTSGIQSDSDDNEDVQSHFTRGDTKQMKRYAEEILQHERSTIQVKPDGTVIITPHPRQLANEILARIVNYVIEQTQLHYYLNGRQTERQRNLYTCTLVSKQFYAIANPLLWQEPVLDVELTHLQRLLDCLAGAQQPLGQYVCKLHFYNYFCTDTQLLLLMTHVRHLETLSIENVTFTNDFPSITNTSLQHLPRYCSHLTSLKLFNINLSETTIRAIGQHCRQLRELTLYPSSALCDDIFSALFSCPLEMLQLSYETEGYFSEKMAMDMTRFQGLTHLTLDNVDPSVIIMTFANNAQDKNYDGTTPVLWPHLKKLSLDFCHDIDDTTFICFIKTHPHLQFLRLSEANLTDASLDAISVSLRDLTKLLFVMVNGISLDGIHRLIRNTKGLVLASFESCRQIMKSDFLKSGGDEHSLRLGESDIDKIRNAQGTGNGK